MINGNRIKQAREIRRMTQTTLAENVGVKQPAINRMEKGIISPSDEVLQKIAIHTGFPVSFFKQPDSPDFISGTILFRARAEMAQKDRDSACQYARIIIEIAENMESNFNRIPLKFPITDNDPIMAAVNTRLFWGLSKDEPITNLINILEQNGIMILALPFSYEKQDAFSSWFFSDTKRPIIVISNSTVSGDRLRFSMAHELAHLILHQSFRDNTAKAHKEADLFASEFLMPKESMLRELIPPITLASLMELKRRWRVSIQALIMRSYHLRIITERQYKYLITKWHRRTEPVAILPEKPRLLGQMIEGIYGSSIDYKRIALQMNLPVEMIEKTLVAHSLRIKDNNDTPSLNGKVLQFTKKEMNQM